MRIGDQGLADHKFRWNVVCKHVVVPSSKKVIANSGKSEWENVHLRSALDIRSNRSR